MPNSHALSDTPTWSTAGFPANGPDTVHDSAMAGWSTNGPVAVRPWLATPSPPVSPLTTQHALGSMTPRAVQPHLQEYDLAFIPLHPLHPLHTLHPLHPSPPSSPATTTTTVTTTISTTTPPTPPTPKRAWAASSSSTRRSPPRRWSCRILRRGPSLKPTCAALLRSQRRACSSASVGSSSGAFR